MLNYRLKSSFEKIGNIEVVRKISAGYALHDIKVNAIFGMPTNWYSKFFIGQIFLKKIKAEYNTTVDVYLYNNIWKEDKWLKNLNSNISLSVIKFEILYNTPSISLGNIPRHLNIFLVILVSTLLWFSKYKLLTEGKIETISIGMIIIIFYGNIVSFRLKYFIGLVHMISIARITFNDLNQHYEDYLENVNTYNAFKSMLLWWYNLITSANINNIKKAIRYREEMNFISNVRLLFSDRTFCCYLLFWFSFIVYVYDMALN